MKHCALCQPAHQHRGVIVSDLVQLRVLINVAFEIIGLVDGNPPPTWKLVAKTCGSAENPRSIDEAPSILDFTQDR